MSILKSLNDAPPAPDRMPSFFSSGLASPAAAGGEGAFCAEEMSPAVAWLISHSMLVAESAFAIASSCVILPSMKSLNSACSKVCEPGDMLFSSASLISPISPFSISSAMCRVFSSTSTAAMRPPPLVRTRRCEITACSAADRSSSRLGRFSSG